MSYFTKMQIKRKTKRQKILKQKKQYGYYRSSRRRN